MTILVGVQSYNLVRQFSEQVRYDNYFSIEKNTTDNCIPLLDLGRVYRKPEIDFIHRGMGYIDALPIAEKYGKQVCKD